MTQTDKVYMQFVPRASKLLTEIDAFRSWLKTQKGIKQYCERHPEASAEALRLVGEASNALRQAMQVFMRGESAIIR